MDSLNPDRVKAIEEWASLRREIHSLEDKISKKRARLKELEKSNLFLGNVKGMCARGKKKKTSQKAKAKGPAEASTSSGSSSAKKRKMGEDVPAKKAGAMAKPPPVPPLSTPGRGTSRVLSESDAFTRTLVENSRDSKFRNQVLRLLSEQEKENRGRSSSVDSAASTSTEKKE